MKESHPIKTHDYRYDYRGYYSEGGVCRVRVYTTEPPTILVSELAENRNTSVTNMCEHLYPEIVRKHFPEQFSDATPITWLEHYPPMEGHGKKGTKQEYTLVEFRSYTPRRVSLGGVNRLEIGSPDWKHISEAAVTKLLGHDPGKEDNEKV